MNAPLWQPTRSEQSRMHAFMQRAGQHVRGRPFADYDELHAWSIDQGDAFWDFLLDELDLIWEGDRAPVCVPGPAPRGPMFGSRYFPNARLNYAENLLRHAQGELADSPALVGLAEGRERCEYSHAALWGEVARVAAGLRDAGVVPGDRVAGFMPNCPEAVIAMLASAAIGAAWSSCSPDFGAQGVLDRFGQIAPKVLVVANGYRYGGKDFDSLAKVQAVVEAIPAIEALVLVDFSNAADKAPAAGSRAAAICADWTGFGDAAAKEIVFDRGDFNRPLYIMYSSGTTGVPKCIVHGAGGTLLQHAKELLLHSDLRAGDRLLYYTTCGWMMWNWMVSGLYAGATLVLYDGSPAGDAGPEHLWRIVAEERLSHFGTSAKFLGICRDQLRPGEQFDLSALRVLLSTGSPLLPEDFDWVYGAVKPDLQLASISGGTDIIACFMLGNPLLPVYRGELQAAGLGMAVTAVDEAGREVRIGEKGELCCTQPFVSMPVAFWNDPEGDRYHGAYFEHKDGSHSPHWLHGDYIANTGSQGRAGGFVVYGRSDATLNPGGVRIGTAEIYRQVETLPEIADAIVVGQPFEDDVRVVLFVKLVEGAQLDDALRDRIKRTIRSGTTPRHVPAVIAAVADIPYTISGKKVELAVQGLLMGKEPDNLSALKNPESLDGFRGLVF